MEKLTRKELGILKYYKEGNEMCGFEKGSPWKSLREKDFLDGDLELTFKARDFIKNYTKWDKVVSFKNETYISIKLPIAYTE